MINKSSNKTRTPAAPIGKEKTAREKALEFAKNNVPKPKQRRDSLTGTEGQGTGSVPSQPRARADIGKK